MDRKRSGEQHWAMTSMPKQKKMLGEYLELWTQDSDARITEKRGAALEICDDQDLDGHNARQIMLKYKGAHGSRKNLDFQKTMRSKPTCKGTRATTKSTSTGRQLHFAHRLVGSSWRLWHMGAKMGHQPRAQLRSYGQQTAARAANNAPAAAGTSSSSSCVEY